jgi:hypothetical protein
MSTCPTRHCRWALGLAALLATGGAAPAQRAKELFPGARLLPRYPKESYRVPALCTTDKGPRLLVWVDASDPNPRQTIPGIPVQLPPFEVVFWDLAAGKALHTISSAREGAPQSPVPANWDPTSFGRFGLVALAPDGMRLAYVNTTYRIVPGKPEHEATRQIHVYSQATRKWTDLPTKYRGTTGGPHVLFAPDGSLLIFKDATCTILEMPKAKVRRTFKIVRGQDFASHTVYSHAGIHDALVSPDGALLAVAAEGLLTVYDLATGKEVFRADRAAPPGDPGKGKGQATGMVSLAFAPAAAEAQLLAAEVVTGPRALVLARLFDLKAKKQLARWVLADEPTKPRLFDAPQPWGGAHAYFTPKAEPRLIFDGKVIDGTTGKVLHRFDAGVRVLVSTDGKYLVRLTRAAGDAKKLAIQAWSLDSGK